MIYSDSLSYFVAIVAIALAPGPAALVMLVRSASRDVAGALGFGLGYSLGGVVIVAAVCLGMSAWMSTFPSFLDVAPFVMLAYMLN